MDKIYQKVYISDIIKLKLKIRGSFNDCIHEHHRTI